MAQGALSFDAEGEPGSGLNACTCRTGPDAGRWPDGCTHPHVAVAQCFSLQHTAAGKTSCRKDELQKSSSLAPRPAEQKGQPQAWALREGLNQEGRGRCAGESRSHLGRGANCREDKTPGSVPQLHLGAVPSYKDVKLTVLCAPTGCTSANSCTATIVMTAVVGPSVTHLAPGET